MSTVSSVKPPKQYTYPDILHLLGDFYKGRDVEQDEILPKQSKDI